MHRAPTHTHQAEVAESSVGVGYRYRGAQPDTLRVAVQGLCKLTLVGGEGRGGRGGEGRGGEGRGGEGRGGEGRGGEGRGGRGGEGRGGEGRGGEGGEGRGGEGRGGEGREGREGRKGKCYTAAVSMAHYTQT